MMTYFNQLENWSELEWWIAGKDWRRSDAVDMALLSRTVDDD